MKYRRAGGLSGGPRGGAPGRSQTHGLLQPEDEVRAGPGQKLLDDFDGEVPGTIAELITLPGVARKTANIVQATAFPRSLKKDPDAGIAVDTHVGRVAVRLGSPSTLEGRGEDRDGSDGAVPQGEVAAGPQPLHHARPHDLRREETPLRGLCVEPLCPSSQEAGFTDLFRVPPKKTDGQEDRRQEEDRRQQEPASEEGREPPRKRLGRRARRPPNSKAPGPMRSPSPQPGRKQLPRRRAPTRC